MLAKDLLCAKNFTYIQHYYETDLVLDDVAEVEATVKCSEHS